MAWVSLVIVALVFFTPVVGLSGIVEQQYYTAGELVSLLPESLPLPFGGVLRDVLRVLPVPFSGYLRLFLYCLASWLVVWLLLLMLESMDEAGRLKLRPGLLFAGYPPLSIRIAVWLAQLVLAYAASTVVVPLLVVAVPALLSGIGLLEVARAASQGLRSLVGLLSYSLDLRVIVLSVLVCLADHVFELEQRRRYDVDLQRNRRQRKARQRAVAVH